MQLADLGVFVGCKQHQRLLARTAHLRAECGLALGVPFDAVILAHRNHQHRDAATEALAKIGSTRLAF